MRCYIWKEGFSADSDRFEQAILYKLIGDDRGFASIKVSDFKNDVLGTEGGGLKPMTFPGDHSDIDIGFLNADTSDHASLGITHTNKHFFIVRFTKSQDPRASAISN